MAVCRIGRISAIFTLAEYFLVKKVGALDTKFAGTADSEHSMFKCLVNT